MTQTNDSNGKKEMFFIEADNNIMFHFFQYNKPRKAKGDDGPMISIKTSGNLDQKPWCDPLYFDLEGKQNRITNTNVEELRQYIKN